MIGLVIGLLVTLVIMQVFSIFEEQKRATTGTNDAQVNGSIALYTISHELQLAGYGLITATDPALKCATMDFGGTGITDLTPVTITDGNGASDTITIRYGNSPSGGVQEGINAVAIPGANDVALLNNMGCQVGDVAMVVTNTTCNFSTVTGPTDLAVPPVATGPAGALDNTKVTLQNIPAGTISGSSSLACLGTWNEVTFRVNPAFLADPTAAPYLERNIPPNTTPSVSGIVNIQAQYGISDSANSNLVTQWVNATGAWAAPTVDDRNRIKAVRIAVVARNGLKEKDVVDSTTACSSTTAASPTGLCAWDATSALPTPLVAPFVASPAPSIDLTADGDWRHYRYRVFETIVPLRNVIWSRSAL
jgi:type IV pilus assembly protein PilW